jgi:hypothetical protein
MKIGNLDLEVGAPDAERLLSSTGLSVAEMREHLRSTTAPGLIARALAACIGEGEAIAGLARSIAEHGVRAARAEILKLYDEAETVIAEPIVETKVTKRGRRKAS